VIPAAESVLAIHHPKFLNRNLKTSASFCRTFPPVSPQGLCSVCKCAEERRAQVAFGGEPRQFAAITARRDVLNSRLSRLDIRLSTPVPRLFVISGLKDSKDWLRSHHRTRYCMYYLCIHSMKAMQSLLPIIMTKHWLENVAPVLAMSLYLLHDGLKPGELKLIIETPR
jgi:hypothetical protein